MPIKVLLIADSPDETARLVALFGADETAAVECDHAVSVDAALALAPTDTWQAILVDVGTGGHAELGAIERLHQAAPNVPILALAGGDSNRIAVNVIRAGAQNCLGKADLDGSALTCAIRCATERARSPAAVCAAHVLAERLKNFEAIVNRSPAVLILWRVADGYYPVDFVSENIRQFGYTPEELMSDRDLWASITHPDDVLRIRAEVAAHFQQGVHEFFQEYRIRTKSGETRWVEDRNLALVNGDGVITHVQGVVLDVTEQRLAQKRYEASEGKLRAMSDVALDAVVMMDPAGNVAHWNPAAERMFGYSHDEIHGRSIHGLLMPPEYRQRADARLQQFAQSGTGPAVGKVLELSAFRKDGSRFPIEISVAPIRLDQGWGAVGIIRDITRRKWTEDAVAREQRQLRRVLEVHERDHALLASEIHDRFVQPLTGALMNLEGSLAQLAGQATGTARDQYTRAIGLFRNSIDRARQLMSRLRPSILDEFGLASAIENLVSEAQDTDGPSIRHSYDVQSQHIAAPLEIALFRIVQEGLTNACIHGKGAEVRIDIRQQDRHLCVEIEDDGVGFDPKQVPPECFGIEGIRDRARLFGGRATIESNPGFGTRIFVELPLVETVSDGPGAPRGQGG